METTTGYKRGAFNDAQKRQLLKPIKGERVMHLDGHSHLSQQDVRAHLIRTFDFGGFDIEILDIGLVFEQQYDKPATNNKPERKGVWDACYKAVVRLTIRNPELEVVTILEDGSTATASAQGTRGAAHDLAYKSAISLSIKRAATSLGDQFGLGLYNKGSQAAIVRNTIAQLEALKGADDTTPTDIQDGIEQQESLGLDDDQVGDYDDNQDEPAEPSAKPVATKRATNGRQGAKRAAVAKAEPQAERVEIPATLPHSGGDIAATADIEPPEAAAPVVDLNRARAQDALPGETEPEYQMRKRREREAAEAMQREQRKAEEQAAIDVAEDEERAERQRQAAAQEAKIREEEAAAASVERIKAERAQRGAPVKATPEEATAIVKAEPEPWSEPAVGAEPDWRAMTLADWSTHAEGLKNIIQVKASWDAASAANALTTEARMELIKRKARIESAAKPAAEPEQSTLA